MIKSTLQTMPKIYLKAYKIDKYAQHKHSISVIHTLARNAYIHPLNQPFGFWICLFCLQYKSSAGCICVFLFCFFFVSLSLARSFIFAAQMNALYQSFRWWNHRSIRFLCYTQFTFTAHTFINNFPVFILFPLSWLSHVFFSLLEFISTYSLLLFFFFFFISLYVFFQLVFFICLTTKLWEELI